MHLSNFRLSPPKTRRPKPGNTNNTSVLSRRHTRRISLKCSSGLESLLCPELLTGWQVCGLGSWSFTENISLIMCQDGLLLDHFVYLAWIFSNCLSAFSLGVTAVWSSFEEYIRIRRVNFFIFGFKQKK